MGYLTDLTEGFQALTYRRLDTRLFYPVFRTVPKAGFPLQTA